MRAKATIIAINTPKNLAAATDVVQLFIFIFPFLLRVLLGMPELCLSRKVVFELLGLFLLF